MKTIPYDMVMWYIPEPTQCCGRLSVKSTHHLRQNTAANTPGAWDYQCTKVHSWLPTATTWEDDGRWYTHSSQTNHSGRLARENSSATWNITILVFRDELTIEDGLLLKNTRIIIPTSKRDDLLRQIHCGHLGTIKCQLCAKETVYWPGITKGIEDMVHNCETCLRFSVNKPKAKLDNALGHEVPAIPWTKLATDIFTFDSENYLLVVGLYFQVSNNLQVVIHDSQSSDGDN